MKTKTDRINFCNDAVFYDYKHIGTVEEIDQVRKGIINNFFIKQFPILEYS